MIWPLCAPPPQEDVADKALAAFLVVGLDAMGGEECAERVANLIEHAGLQLTVRAGDDAMGAASIKTNAGLAVFVPPDRELHFIAVAVHLGEGTVGSTGTSSPPMRRNASVTFSCLACSSAL